MEEVIPPMSNDLEVIFYDPNQTTTNRNTYPAKPPWQKLADRIGTVRPTRLEVQHLVECLPAAPAGEKPLDTVSRLALGVFSEHERSVRELVLISLCSILSTSGRAAPEQLDKVMMTLVTSSEPRYLDRLKRGARFANEIIATWAAKDINDGLRGLDRATQAVLQARLTVSQWSTLNGYSSKVKEYILSRTLPPAPSNTAGPFLYVPCLIESITNQSLKVPQICQCLGYSDIQTSYLVTLPTYGVVIDYVPDGINEADQAD